MANPYEQFDKKEKSNSYAQFDKKKDNPYSKFDNEKDVEDLSFGEAAGRGFLSAVLPFAQGANELTERKQSKTPEGLTLSEAASQSAAEQFAPAYEQHPVAAISGSVGGTVGLMAPAAVLPGSVLPALSAGTAAYLQSYGSRKTELMEGDPEKRAAAEKAAIAGAMVDAPLSMVPGGIALKGASLPAKIVQRAATGAGLSYGSGAAGDIAQNVAADESLKQVDPFSMERRAVDVATGGALGPIFGSTLDLKSGKATSTPTVKEDIPEEVPSVAEAPLGEASRGSDRLLADSVTQIGKDIDRAEYKLKQIEQEVGERQFETPEQAEQFKLAKTEEYVQLVREIEELKKSLDTANKYMGKEAPPMTRAEIPSSPPPRPEGEVVANETAPIPAAQATNKDMFDQAPVEDIQLAPLERMGEGEFEDLSSRSNVELEEEISSLDINTPEGQTRFEQIAQELSSRVRPVEKRAIIEGGSEYIRSVVKDWLVKTGLDKEDIYINLDSTDPSRFTGTQLGNATVLPSGISEINVRSPKAMQQVMEDLGPHAARWMRNLTPEQEARFKEAWTAAHELGHIMLTKLLQNKLYSDSLGLSKLIKDYNAWLGKHKAQGTVVMARAEGNLFGRPSKEDYFLDFPEFFAQRVARELVLGKSAPKKDAISRFVSDARSMFREIMQKMRLPYFKENFVDEFIQGIISKNRQALEETGKTLWEIDATTVSMYDAWSWQWEAGLIKRKDKEHTLASMSDKAGVQAAVRHIKNADTVIAEQMAVPDIHPSGSKSISMYASSLVTKAGSNLFGILNKSQFYKNSPMVSYASDVILNGLHQQTKRSMELLTGVTDRAAWDKKNKLGISLKKVKDDESFSVIAERSSNEDFHVVHQILEKGIGKYSYEESLNMFGGNLTEKQKSLYRATTKMYANMYKMASQTEQALGKKGIIPNMKGWYPAMRKGEFTVNFRIEGVKRVAGRDPTGKALMTDLVHSQSFRTEGEARAFIDHFEKQSPEFKGMLQHGGVEKAADPEMINSLADFHRAYLEQRTKLEADVQDVAGGRAAEWLEEEADRFKGDHRAWLDFRMQKMVDMYIARGGTLGGHHRLRTNVSGAMGSEMFTTPHNAGKAFRDSNFKAVDEYTNMMMKMDVQEKLDLMLSKEELKQSHPNTLEVVQLMRDYALNEVKSPLEMKGFKASVDAVWEHMWDKTPMKKMKVFGAEKYMDASVTDLALGKLGHMFYIHALMSRPSFWAAQGVQFLWAGRTMVKDGVGPVGAMTHAGRGLWQVLHPDQEFMDAIFHVSQTSHTFSPQFINDLNKHGIGDFLQEGSKGKLLLDLATGEKQSTMADTFSRLMTFGMVYEHYKSRGLRGTELAEAAARATDENMVQYSRQYKAPVFQKMGVVGDLVSPLQTFSQAALGNLVADAGAMLQAPGGKAKVKAALPFMATVAITGLMAGTIGVPMVAEYEALRLFINYLSEKLGGKPFMPSIIDTVLQGDNTFSNRLLSHGLISASTMPTTDGEGLDIAASNRWQPLWGGLILGEKTFMESIPVINFWLDRASDMGAIVKHRTGITELSDAERREAALGIVPGMYKGAVDDLLFNAQGRDFVPTMKGDAFTEQTGAERVAKYLGTSTIKSSTERLRERRTKEVEMRTQAKVDKTFELLADAVQKGNAIRIQALSRKLADEFQIDIDQQESRLKRELFNRTVPSRTRQFVGGSGTSSTQQQKRAKYWQDTYDVPIVENE